MDDPLLAELGFMQWLLDQGYLEPRPIGGGRYAAVKAFMFTHAIITGEIHNHSVYEDRWCYRTEADALSALKTWDGQGEPSGWHRHPATGRRVDEEGREYVYR